MEQFTNTGNYFKEELNKLALKYTGVIKDVRGRGLMLGVEVNHSGQEIVDMAIENKLIFNAAGGGQVLRFVPPLIIKKEQIDTALQILDGILNKLN